VEKSESKSTQESPRTTSSFAISIKSFSFKYFGSESPVLEKINLEIPRGQAVIIAGLSGSGKSTLLRSINGLIPHQHGGDYSGRVVVDGLEVAQTKMSDLAVKVGYIFQNPENQIFMFSVERDVAFGLENLGYSRSAIRERVDWALNTLGIKDLALCAPHELSDGQKQRVAIAGVIAMKPSVLIFDEPTSLLDPYTARSLIQLIQELHKNLAITILIVEHRLDLVSKIADRLVVIDEGKIVFDGTPRQVLYESNVSLYGVSEPAIVKLAKLLGTPTRYDNPLSAPELAHFLVK
jgi:energy-coupling factor transporter ATP-binding protein EcfA2